jgi:hypothetical protein
MRTLKAFDLHSVVTHLQSGCQSIGPRSEKHLHDLNNPVLLEKQQGKLSAII